MPPNAAPCTIGKSPEILQSCRPNPNRAHLFHFRLRRLAALSPPSEGGGRGGEAVASRNSRTRIIRSALALVTLRIGRTPKGAQIWKRKSKSGKPCTLFRAQIRHLQTPRRELSQVSSSLAGDGLTHRFSRFPRFPDGSRRLQTAAICANCG